MSRPDEETTFKLYELLEADPSCTDEQLKRAYHKKALKMHPDKTGGREQASFIVLKDGYALLKDPLVRKFYNRHGDQGIENFKKKNEKSFNLFDTTMLLSRLMLRVLTHPTGIVPVSLSIGLMFSAVVLFFWCADWKLAGWSWSWTFVFSLLWFAFAFFSVFLVAMNILTFLSVRSLLNPVFLAREISDEMNKNEIKKTVVSIVFSLLKMDIFIVALVWFSISLHRALVEAQPSVSWTVWPLAWATYIIALLCIIEYAMGRKTLATARLRGLKLIKMIIDNFELSLFFTALAFGAGHILMPVAAIVVPAATCCSHYFGRLKVEEQTNISLRMYERSTTDPFELQRVKEVLQKNMKREKVLRSLRTACTLWQDGFFFTHLLFGWPRTWTWTASLFVVSAFIQSITFLLFIPFVLWAMDRLLPDVSNKTLSELKTGASEDCVVIDLPAKTIYSFGYAFGRFQPRIKSK